MLVVGSSGFGEFEMIIPHPSHQEGGYYMDNFLYENLEALPKRINKDKDVLGVVVGRPGEGKSISKGRYHQAQ